MPTLSKRPPARICAFLLAPLLLCIGAGAAPLHAQTTGSGVIHVWFNPAGDAKSDFSGALRELKVGGGASTAANFTLELMGKVTGVGAGGVQSMAFEIHYDSDKIAWRPAKNIKPANASVPDADPHFTGITAARYAADGLGKPLDDADPATDSLLYPAWVDLRESWLREGKVVRLATLRGTWKAGATGGAALNIRAAADQLPYAARNFRGQDLVIQGPPAAQ